MSDPASLQSRSVVVEILESITAYSARFICVFVRVRTSPGPPGARQREHVGDAREAFKRSFLTTVSDGVGRAGSGTLGMPLSARRSSVFFSLFLLAGSAPCGADWQHPLKKTTNTLLEVRVVAESRRLFESPSPSGRYARWKSVTLLLWHCQSNQKNEPYFFCFALTWYSKHKLRSNQLSSLRFFRTKRPRINQSISFFFLTI